MANSRTTVIATPSVGGEKVQHGALKDCVKGQGIDELPEMIDCVRVAAKSKEAPCFIRDRLSHGQT